MHTLTWLIWLIAAGAAVGLAPNPLYLALILLIAWQVFQAWRNDSPLAQSFALFLRFGAWICAGYVIFSVITVGGARGATLIVALPTLQLPDWLGGVVLGGPITAEALAYGLTRGLSIWALMAVFGTFNALVDHYRLLRLSPRSLYHAGLIITIATAFVPSIVRAISEIAAAQRARGHRFGRPASWIALVGPLLAGSLEKSLQLAEALDSRGYGYTVANAQMRRLPQMLSLGGLIALIAAIFVWFYYGVAASVPALLFLITSGILSWLGLRQIGQAVARSAYRRERRRRRDHIAVAAATAALLILAILRVVGSPDMVYYPFPTLSAPSFDLRVGIALLLLAVPVFVAAPQRERRAAPRRRSTASVRRTTPLSGEEMREASGLGD